MAVSGKQKEVVNFVEQSKYVGLFEGRVVAINPSAEEFEELTGWKPKEDSKQFDYLGESKDGNITLRIDVWIEEVKKRVNADGEEIHNKFKVTFFLEDKERENKDGTRKQYINPVGVCSWAAEESDLPDWFSKREYRPAFAGEDQLYTFMRTWLSKLDTRDADAVLEFEWKKLMRGNVKELRDQINGEWSDTVVFLATIETREKEDGVVEYQKIYNNAFLLPYSLKFFRITDYNDPEVIAKLKAKKPRNQKYHEKFVLTVTDEEYGCKDFYILKDLKEYDPSDNVVSSDKVISEEGPDY